MRSVINTRAFKIILISVLGYIVILFSFFLFADSLIYQRTTLSHDFTFKFNGSFTEHFITTPDNVSINALLFTSPSASKGLIFYLHGNADDLRRWGKYAQDFTSLGYDVFVMDYRGYGKSSGRPEEDKLHQDAAFVLNWVNTHFAPKRLIIYGRSLGSPIASRLAVKAEPDLLILETPFADFKDVIPLPLKPALYLFPIKAHYSNSQWLAQVKCPKFIFHGTEDWIVPLSSAKKLKPLSEEFIIIEGGGHRNLRDFKLYHDKLNEILL